MDKPEKIEQEIEQEIEELKNKLKASKLHYQYEPVCDDSFSEDMIGFFNLGNTRKILKLLYDGKKLQYRHGVYGNVAVYMNPQRNRILVSENKFINEDNIMSFIVWLVGKWYLDIES